MASGKLNISDFKQLPRKHIIEHRSLNKIMPVEFMIGEQFKLRNEQVVNAIRLCSAEKVPDSKWKIVNHFSKSAASASGGRPKKRHQVQVDDMKTLWTWLTSQRQVVNTSFSRMVWRKDMPVSL